MLVKRSLHDEHADEYRHSEASTLSGHDVCIIEDKNAFGKD